MIARALRYNACKFEHRRGNSISLSDPSLAPMTHMPIREAVVRSLEAKMRFTGAAEHFFFFTFFCVFITQLAIFQCSCTDKQPRLTPVHHVQLYARFVLEKTSLSTSRWAEDLLNK